MKTVFPFSKKKFTNYLMLIFLFFTYNNINAQWQLAGSPTLKNGNIYVKEFIDVTQVTAYPISTTAQDNSYNLNHIISSITYEAGKFTILYFPQGTYNFKGEINITNDLHKNIIIKGAGSDYTTFYFDLQNPSEDEVCFHITVSGISIEDIKIEQEPNIEKYCGTSNNFPLSNWKNSTIKFEGATDCWIMGVESIMTHKAHVMIISSSHITVSGCYFHEANEYSDRSGRGYGIQLTDEANYCLIENNIFYHLRHSIVLQTKAENNVIAYNYSGNSFAYNVVFIGNPEYLIVGASWDYFDEVGDILFHGRFTSPIGPTWNLIEGNCVHHIRLDYLASDNHYEQGPWNYFLRNKASKGISIEDAGGNINQYSQTIIGCYAKPIDIPISPPIPNTWNFINDHGIKKFWWKLNNTNTGIIPDWDGIKTSSGYDSRYLSGAPAWWPYWDPWPFQPDLANPAEWRFLNYSPPWTGSLGWSHYSNICDANTFTNINITEVPDLQTYFQAVEYITASYSILTSEPVTFVAGDYIELNPGFETYDGGEFEAYIDDVNCDGSIQKIMSSQYNPPPSVETPSNKNNITKTDSVYFNLTPNPCKTFVQIEYSTNNDKDVIIEIYNIAGNKLKQLIYRGGKNIEILDISELTNGIYTYRVFSGDKLIKANKIVVIK